jgi:hypothetical protein
MATEGNFFIFAMRWHLYGSHVAVSFMAIIFSFFRQKKLKKRFEWQLGGSHVDDI